jgi:cytosine/adenosine deaminase-related metal-dependent hydrolase
VTAFDLKIEHATVVTVDGRRRILRDGAVAIRGDRIAAVDDTAALAGRPAARTIDAAGRLVLPGLVSAHAPHGGALARVLGPAGPGPAGAPGRPRGGEALLTEEDAYWVALLACAEMIRTGTTCHADPGGYAMEGVGRALTECGIRGTIAWAAMDEFPPGHDPGEDHPGRLATGEALAAGERLVRRWHRTAGDRIRASYGLGSEACVSDDLFQGVRELAERDETLVQFPCLLPGRVAAVRERTGMSTVQWMAGLGVLGPNWVLGRLSEASDSDVVIVKAHDAKVAHCPGASSPAEPGAAPPGRVPELLRRGVAVALGWDPAAGGGPDLFEAMARAAADCGDAGRATGPVGPGAALEMATLGGARALGWDADVGSLEPGKRADVIVTAARGPAGDDETLVAGLVAGGAGGVEAAVIDGRIVMEEGRLTTLDAGRALDEVRRIAERVAGGEPGGGARRPRWRVG